MTCATRARYASGWTDRNGRVPTNGSERCDDVILSAMKPSRRDVAPPGSTEVVLKETAMVRVGGARVGCSNLWEREHLLEDGSTITAMSARVAIAAQTVVVRVGTELAIDGARYVVIAIDKPHGHLGRVVLSLRAPSPEDDCR